MLHRFHQLAIDALGDDLRLAHHQFVALAAHHLDGDRKLKLAAPEHLERVGRAHLFHAQRNVGKQLLRQALAQIARRDVGAFASCERRSIHCERHCDGRLVDHNRRQRCRIDWIRNRLPDRDSFHSSDGDNVAQHCFRNVRPLQSGKGKQFSDLGLVQRSIALGDNHVFARVHRSIEHARDRQTSEEIAVIEIRDQNLQRPGWIALRQRSRLQNRVKQRPQIFAAALHVRRCRPLLCIRVENWKVELVFLCVKIDKQVVDFVEHFLRTRIGPINLVDHHDWRQLRLQRLGQHVARLRQGPFARVHQQHHSVHHLQCTFHLAAKVTVAGRIHNVDLHVVIENGRILSQNCDAALALQFVRIHHAFDVVLVGAKSAALLQHGID